MYTSEEFINLSTIDKLHLKCDAIVGSVLNAVRQPILYSFVITKPPICKFFCEPETIHYNKNKSVLKTITFYLEDDSHTEVNFNVETLTFTLQLVKI